MLATIAGILNIVVGIDRMTHSSTFDLAALGVGLLVLGALLTAWAIKSWIDYAKEPMITTTE